MHKFFSLFLIGLRKDLLNATSYKIQFFGSFIIIFFNLTIYYYFLEFIGASRMGEDKIDYFKYLFVGLLVTDFSVLIVRSLSGPITTYKNQGIFEELMSMPISEIQIILNSLPYALFNGFLRIFCFIAFYSFLYGLPIISPENFIIILASIFLFILCSCGISLIFAGVTLIFHRGEGLPFAYSAISTLFGGVFYPVSVISDNLDIVTNALPIKHILEIIRGLSGVSDYSQEDLCFNILFLLSLAMIFIIIGYLVWKKSLDVAKKEASLYLY
jgi:ABC-2 type transport system permease protein